MTKATSVWQIESKDEETSEVLHALEEQFLQNQELVHERRSEGRSTLHHAAKMRLPRVTQLLLTHGADPNARDEGGETPLFYLFDLDLTKDSPSVLAVATSLLDAGADPNVTDANNVPLHYIALQWDYTLLAELLEARGANVCLNAAILLGRFDAVREMLQHDLEALRHAPLPNQIGFDALSHNRWPDELRARHRELLRVLLQAGLDPNQRVYGKTVFFQACYLGCPLGILELLVHYGADINALADNGQTPLDVAIQYWGEEQQCYLRSLGGKTASELRSGWSS